MKKTTIFLLIIWLISSCKDTQKPKNIISEDKMMDILYDLTILQAIHSNDYKLLSSYDLKPETFIYQKYNIDSLQFIENHRYYISNIDKYEKMIEKIIDRAEAKKDSISKQNYTGKPIRSELKSL